MIYPTKNRGSRGPEPARIQSHPSAHPPTGNWTNVAGSRGHPIVLDATLRDGGYLNDWQFLPKQADAAVRLASDAGADVIEVGYLDDSPGLPEAAGCPEDLLVRLRALAGSARLAGMLRPTVADLEGVLDRRMGHIDLVRIPTQIGDAEPARIAAEACRVRGIAVSANLTNVTAYSAQALAAAVRRLAPVVDLVYLADSRGSLRPQDVACKVEAVRGAWSGPIGFHAHDNLGLAAGNTEAALDAGCSWIDGTVSAVGMGGRNLCLYRTLDMAGRLGPSESGRHDGQERLRVTREADLGVDPPGADSPLYRMGAERNTPQDWPRILIERFGLAEATRRLRRVPERSWFTLQELEPWLAPDLEQKAAVRMRIYESQTVDHDAADRVFYEKVKPVHERHGAVFVGRYRDEDGRVIVQWLYPSAEHLKRVQERIASDPATLRNRAERLAAGLHALKFTEFVLRSTALASMAGEGRAAGLPSLVPAATV